MGISSSLLQPQELATFKKLPTDVPFQNIAIPERAENRVRTDWKWLIGFGIFILLLLPFMIYTLCYADVARIFVGTDGCGNTCGKKNYQWEGIPCSGKDFRDSPYLHYESYYGGDSEYNSDLSKRECVQSCKEGYTALFGRCLKQSSRYQFDTNPGHGVTREPSWESNVDLSIYFSSVKWQLIIACLLSILFSLGMLFLFRYAVAFVVWGILLGSFLGLLILVGVFWYFYSVLPEPQEKANDDSKQIMLVMGIVFTIIAIVLGIVLIWSRKKVRLVILLLKETTKAVFAMPGLTLVPLICVFVLLILSGLFILTTTYMASAGTLQKAASDFYVYVQNPVMSFSIVYNLVVYLWLTQFFTGIQYMIIAGAVAKWYFARDKNSLDSPILNSASIAFKFHLGTVAFGSLIITIIQVIKMIIMSLIKNDKVRILVQSCINAVENFFKFLSKNAYIITAMHGQPFLRSGKRAAKLIIQNVSDIIAVNFIGDFVLGMAKLLIVIVTLLVSAGIFALAPGVGEIHDFPSYIAIGIFALVVSVVSFGVFETTIDTIFVCYCEDSLLNDGMARPYYMSRNLAEFVEESKQIYGKK